ncbi:UNVERIFIED_CONTAM: hypothetical protein Sangu_0469200 [Sesamum angustifolium]|uniref:Uncharacterized protein n=1 Tax=Sesamum angustifolium TaxID=2727405 RepID=A0AAW2QUR3_9LAMI
MKSRLAASMRYSRNSISSRSVVAHRQINSSSRSVQSSAVEDEAFAELGPEISDCSTKHIKLVTEKPDHRLAPSSHTRPRIKDIVANIGGASPTSNSKLGGHSHSFTVTDDTKQVSDIEKPNYVFIKKIRGTVGLSELVEAISVFGKVCGASFVTARNGLGCCKIEFEQGEARMLWTPSITFGMRKSIWTNFKDNSVIDLNRWSAHLLTDKSKSSEVSEHEEARHKLGVQIFECFAKLKRQISMKKVYLEDLQDLHTSIVHIESRPPAPDLSGSK